MLLKQQLVKLIDEELEHSDLPEDLTLPEFIDRVVEIYTIELLQGGFQIPSSHRELAFREFAEEASEIVKKKMYGHLTLEAYRKNKKKGSASTR